MSNWTINEIEGLTAMQIASFADAEHLIIKEHDVYLVDFGGYFGYSALVCADGRHLKYANEYELHYPKSRYDTREKLRNRIIERLNEKLFTEDELKQPSDDYNERQAKEYYLLNTYSYRREKQSIYGDEHEWFKNERDTAVFSWVGCGYYHAYDKDFVDHMNELHKLFKQANDPLRDYEHAYKAFLYEMYNHEYAISWQGDWDVIRCFANVDGNDASDMLPKTGWSDEIKRAYMDASRKAMAVEY